MTTAPAFNPEIARTAFAQGEADETSGRAHRGSEWLATYRRFYVAGWQKSEAANAPIRAAARREAIALLRDIADHLRAAGL